MGSERWTAFAMKELASTLQITEGHNWKRFAQHIGFTKSEIKSKFQVCHSACIKCHYTVVNPQLNSDLIERVLIWF